MTDVSRETFPADRLALAERYAQILATKGIEWGLLGPREADRVWDRHVLNCAALLPFLPETGTLADIGSGAGLPGLVLAIARPHMQVTLVESLLRRATFLAETAAELGLDNVEVVRSRAEDLAGRRSFDIVTARAVAPLGKLLQWTVPLVCAGGSVTVLKGSTAEEEVAEAGPLLAKLGCGTPQIEVVNVSGEPTYIIRISVDKVRL